MKKLHGYILKSFVASFLIGLVSITTLYLVIDISTNLGKFLEAERPNTAAFVASYYLYRLPLILGKLCPVITLLAAAFTLTFLEKRNELTPIKASGISIRRLVLPLVAASAILTAGTLALEEWIIPRCASEIYMKNIEKSDPHLWNQLVHDLEESQYIYYVAYYPPKAMMNNVYVSRTDSDMREKEFTYARLCTFSEMDGGAWTLRDGYTIEFDETGLRRGPLARFEEKRLVSKLRPSDMEHRAIVDEMPLSGLIETWKGNPSLHTLGVRFHFRTALPFANILLLVVGVPVILGGAHRRYFLGTMATAALGGVYFGLVFLSLKLGMNGTIPPWMAGWATPVLFTGVASAVWGLMPT
ncbi:MAG: LptF/LptG family permease [Planctomycetota bacterium]|jgi:lipopolysaccharide export system permease protein